MEYPKPLMSTSELCKMGFPKAFLLEIARMKNSPAFKTSGGGKLIFDTEKLEKARLERMGK